MNINDDSNIVISDSDDGRGDLANTRIIDTNTDPDTELNTHEYITNIVSDEEVLSYIREDGVRKDGSSGSE